MTHVQGWAFSGPEAREDAVTAFINAVETIGLPVPTRNDLGGITLSRELLDGLNALCTDRRGGYAQFSVVLNPEKTRGLTAQQKVLVADKGNGCFGGRLEGSRVVVYTD